MSESSLYLLERYVLKNFPGCAVRGRMDVNNKAKLVHVKSGETVCYAGSNRKLFALLRSHGDAFRARVAEMDQLDPIFEDVASLPSSDLERKIKKTLHLLREIEETLGERLLYDPKMWPGRRLVGLKTGKMHGGCVKTSKRGS